MPSGGICICMAATERSTGRRTQVHTEVRAPIETLISRVVWFAFGFIEVLIAVRFVLKVLDANAQTGFVRLVYGASAVFMTPFNAVFATQRFSGARVEWSALVAIAVYALIGWGVVKLVHAVSPRRSSETIERVVKDDGSQAP